MRHLSYQSYFFVPQPPAVAAKNFWEDDQPNWLKQPPRSYQRHAGAKGRSEFAFFAPWVNQGNDQINSQEPHPKRIHRSPDTGDQGTEAQFIFWKNLGFEEINSQEPRNRWERRGAYLRGDDGTEAPFVLWQNVGWEYVTFWRHQPRERSGALARSDDGNYFPMPGVVTFLPDAPVVVAHKFYKSPEYGDQGIVFPQINFFPAGWEQIFAQPIHKFFKSPDTGDTGIESPFIQFVPTSWPHEQTWKHWPRERWGALARGDDGFEQIELPWFNLGWEQVYAQTLHKMFKSPDIGDAGIESPFIQFTALEWPAPPMWRHWPVERSGAFARGDDGNYVQTVSPVTFIDITLPIALRRLFKSPEYGDQGTQFPLQGFFPVGWEQVYTQPPHRWWKSPEFGDSGIQSPLIQFFPSGWQQVFSQDRHPIYKSPDVGDGGFELPFVQTIFLLGFEQVFSQDKHPRPERFASLVGGDPGFEQIELRWFNLGWEQVYTQPPHRWWKSPDIGDRGNYAPFVFWRNTGWEVQPPQPPHRHPAIRWPAAIMRGDDGNYSPFVFWRNTGWEIQMPQPPRRRWEKVGHLFGDRGTQFPFVQWFNLGWEPTPPLVRHRILYSPTTGDAGNEAPFVPPVTPISFFEAHLPATRWPIPGRRGAVVPIGTGIDPPFIPIIPPIPPIPPRITTGKVFVIDAVPSMDRPLYEFGPFPNLGESCALVFYVGGGLPITPAPVLFTFTRPDGGLQTGDPRYAFIGGVTVGQIMIPSFPAGQYLVYIFGNGELSQRGTWKVSAITTNFFSNTYSFSVV